jgi:hypothetical protein
MLRVVFDPPFPRNGGRPAGVHHPDLSQSRTLNDPARRRSSVAVSPYGCPLPDLTRFDDQESEPLLRGARTSRPPAPAWDHLAQARRKEEGWLYPTVTGTPIAGLSSGRRLAFLPSLPPVQTLPDQLKWFANSPSQGRAKSTLLSSRSLLHHPRMDDADRLELSDRV